MEQLVLTQDEINTFHAIDRQAYLILTLGLYRDPMECMQIIAFWYWLEILCYSSVFINTILYLPWALINDLADEAVACLNCINSDAFPVPTMAESVDGGGIPLTVAVLDKDHSISLPYFFYHRVEAREKIAKQYNNVSVRALTDLMHMVFENNARAAAAAAAMQQQMATASSTVAGGLRHIIGSMSNMTLHPPQRTEQQPPQFDGGYQIEEEKLEPEEEHGLEPEAENRTMFATFSKGYPVAARELREFLMKNFGADCIESLHMEEVAPPKQSLFAKIVFRFGATMDMILNGMAKVKFNINGKHVWVRKFVPYKFSYNKST